MGKKHLSTDRRFEEIKKMVTTLTKKELITKICLNYNEWVQRIPTETIKTIIDFHNYYQFWGKLDPQKNDIELITQRVDILIDGWEKIEKLYHRLEDQRSKHVLLMILENWINFSYDGIESVKENCFKSYFDMDLLHCDEDEVLADLGAFQGDTIEDYLYTYGEECYKKIYAYEMLANNVEILQQKFGSRKNIVIRPVGVSKEDGIMYLSNNGTIDAQSLVSVGDIEVKTVALDKDITEKITLIKADIEGAEQDAILGAQEHIKNDKPKLAISIYHSNKDLIEIFELIEKIQPGYHFYLRYNGLSLFPTDYILIGLPPV